MLLEEHDRETSFRKMERGRAAGDARADDAHVAIDAALERRTLRGGMRRGGVVGADVT
jgi:hypothetical protein